MMMPINGECSGHYVNPPWGQRKVRPLKHSSVPCRLEASRKQEEYVHAVSVRRLLRYLRLDPFLAMIER